MYRIVVLDGFTANGGDLGWESFERLGDLTVYQRTPKNLVIERARHADILLTNKCVVDQAVIDGCPDLKYVGVLATGYNVVDCAYARKKGIDVANIPSYSTESVVQTVFGLMIELFSQIGAHSRRVAAGEWASSEDFCFYSNKLKEMSGKTLGIIGYGRIGQRVKDVARAFGMNVVVYNKGRTGDNESGLVFVKDIDELWRGADVVSFNCPLNAENAGMLNAESIAKMKTGAFVINTARGGLIDEKALCEALGSGKLAGAGLDVLSTEPPKPDNPMLHAKNTVITPHLAWATREARSRLLDIAARNIEGFISGEKINIVN